MTEQQCQALLEIFKQEFSSPLEAGIAVARLAGCAIIPTKEIVWIQPGEGITLLKKVAILIQVGEKFQWKIEESF